MPGACCSRLVLPSKQCCACFVAQGGALYLDGVPYSTHNARVVVTGSKLRDNVATTATRNGMGGVAYLSGATQLSVVDSTATNNTATFGGVGYTRDSAVVRQRWGTMSVSGWGGGRRASDTRGAPWHGRCCFPDR